MEHALLKAGLDALGVHLGGQGHGARELAVAAFDAVVVVLLLFTLKLFFARDDQGVILQADVDIFGFKARQLCVHGYFLVRLRHIDHGVGLCAEKTLGEALGHQAHAKGVCQKSSMRFAMLTGRIVSSELLRSVGSQCFNMIVPPADFCSD